MPSYASTAASLMALSSLAAAFPQGGFANSTTSPVTALNGTVSGNNATTTGANNGTSTGTNTTTSAAPVTESLFCPALDLSVIISPSGVDFYLECATNHFGIIIDVVYNSTLFAKRQAVVAPTNIEDCLAACDDVSACVGTAFDDNLQTCTLFSEVGAGYAATGVDFALVLNSEPATTVSAGATLTATEYSTTVKTISSCAPTVTDCPLDAGAVVTEVIPITSTDYICPTATVIPASPVACSCAYSASTATVYSTTTSAGAVTVVPVSTSVIAVPSPTGTTYSTTTIVSSGAAVTTAPTTIAAAAVASSMSVVASSESVAASAASVLASAESSSAAATAASSASVVASSASVAASQASVAAAEATSTSTSSSAGSSTSAYTGAASQIKVAGGLGAMVAAAALLL